VRPGTVISLRRDQIPIVHPVTGEVLASWTTRCHRPDHRARARMSVAEIQSIAPGAQVQSRPRLPQVACGLVATPTLERVLKERVAALVGDDLAAVEAEIGRELNSPVPLIQEMGGYIAGAGGKRLRPILLLAGRAPAEYRGRGPSAGVRGRAAAYRYPHPRRRGRPGAAAPRRPSANAQWGDDASVLVGDHL